MDESQIDELMELINYLDFDKLDQFFLAIQSIYTLLMFATVICAGGFVIYWSIIKPIKILMNGGFI